AGLAEERRFDDDVVYTVKLRPSADWRAAIASTADATTLEGTPTAALGASCRQAAIAADLPAALPIVIGVRGVPVRGTNRGDCTWPALAVRPPGLVLLTGEWLAAPEGSVPPSTRARLPHDLRPGESAQLDALLLTPRQPGDYRLRLLLVQDGAPEPLAVLE